MKTLRVAICNPYCGEQIATQAGFIANVSAEHKQESQDTTKKFYRRETSYQSLYRQVTLPKHVDVSKAKAKNKHGVLTVEIPLAEIAQPKKLEIEFGD